MVTRTTTTFVASTACLTSNWLFPNKNRSLFRLATGIGEGQHEPGMAERREDKQEEAKQKDGSTKIQKVFDT